jgi:hypothetical protein
VLYGQIKRFGFLYGNQIYIVGLEDMKDKNECVKLIKDIRAKLASGVAAECSCPKTKCEWHGDCYNCVRIHRHFGEHVPNCLQAILQSRVKELARTAEMTVAPAEKTPDEFWDYVTEVAPPKKKEGE